jgi:predicted dehydrogenase
MKVLSRRDLLGAAAASAAFAQDGGKPIGTAFIGTGNRGTYVLRGALTIPGVKIVAVCDLKPDRRDNAASVAARDKPETTADYKTLLARADIDAVFIATPCDKHVEMAIAALEAGKHVYCEKPAGIDAESIGRLVAVARKSKTVFQIGQQLRSVGRMRETIEAIHAGAAGRVVMVKAQRHAGDDLAHDGSSADWFFDALRSGDVIVEMSVHNLDICNWVIASRPDRAAGFGGALVWPDDPPGRTNMDGYSLTYEYANGVKLSYTQVFFHPRGLPGGGQYFYVYTTKGAVDLNTSTFYPRERDANPVVLAPPREEDPHAHTAAFYESIRTGKKPPADIEIAAAAALTAILGREAIYRKRAMAWSELGVAL